MLWSSYNLLAIQREGHSINGLTFKTDPWVEDKERYLPFNEHTVLFYSLLVIISICYFFKLINRIQQEKKITEAMESPSDMKGKMDVVPSSVIFRNLQRGDPAG